MDKNDFGCCVFGSKTAPRSGSDALFAVHECYVEEVWPAMIGSENKNETGFPSIVRKPASSAVVVMGPF